LITTLRTRQRPLSRTVAWWALPTATLLLAATVLLVAVLASISVGAAGLTLERVASVILYPSDSTDSLIVHSLRLPRALVGVAAGACLAAAGALMQGVTRNPLASPGVLGVNAGASLGVLLAAVFLPALPALWTVPVAFVGGLLAATVAYSVASSIGITPLRLALAGVAVSGLFGALANGISILFEERARAVLFTLAGSLANRDWNQANILLPWAAACLLLALAVSGVVNLLSLGDDVARGLGVNLFLSRLTTTLLAVLLASAAVSVVGPIGFVGLIVPHAARALVGPDYRVVVPLSALLGGALLTLADVGARLLAPPSETPVGILVAAIGTPFFIHLARRAGR
jgi:iron complex transport system permease protein